MRLIDADNLFNDQIIVVKNSASLEFIKKIMDIIKEAPTIEAEPIRHGRWISHGCYFTCSVCGEEQYGIDTGRFYCQNCGSM